MNLLLVALLAITVDLRVIDGDTFVWHGETVRIANIDAPELHGAKCESELALAIKATERLTMLLTNQPFELVRLARKDKYGRTLATVVVGKVDIGAQLVHEGLARPWRGRRYPWCIFSRV